MSGEKAAIEVVAELLPEDDGEQLSLFDAPETPAGEAKLTELQRKPGRPKGARNKRTERTIAFLLSRHQDPREMLLELAEANVADLAGRLGCTLLEALQEKRIAAAVVLPFVATRMPIAVNVTKRQAIHLHVSTGAAVTGGTGLAMRLAKIVETQEVSDVETARVEQAVVEQVAQAIDDASE